MKNDTGLLVALVGCPNSGKTALFNALTGARQKVANYAGVTVERKEGFLETPAGHGVRVLDLPGIYGLRARSEDEQVTARILAGQMGEGLTPDLLVFVADATRLEISLRLAVEVKQAGIPAVLVLNKYDLAHRHGMALDIARLEADLEMPVVTTAAIRRDGINKVLEAVDTKITPMLADMEATRAQKAQCASACKGCIGGGCAEGLNTLCQTRNTVSAVLGAAGHKAPAPSRVSKNLDRLFLNPYLGPVLLLGLMFLVFQSVFAWASIPMDMIDAATTWCVDQTKVLMPEGILRDFITDGVLAGVGGVVIFLPQILILYFFIILLEDTGYMARAAFILDRLMGRVGLHGRSFIPLLSSFACAIPGIMASRVIENKRDRLIVIMIAPLMTCSARLPVYALLIAAFIPDTKVLGMFNLQGVVMFALYMAAIVMGLVVAFVLKHTVLKGKPASLVMEMPNYHMPNPRDVLLGLYERARIFMVRAGKIILPLSVIVWFCSVWPSPPEGFTGQPIEYSLTGRIGHLLQPLFAPIGFDWSATASLVPTMAAREVFVSTLSTIYAVADVEGAEQTLATMLHNTWSLPVALALLAWFVIAPQCIATIGTIRRETNSWRWTAGCVAYLFGLAWVVAFAVYRIALAFS